MFITVRKLSETWCRSNVSTSSHFTSLTLILIYRMAHEMSYYWLSQVFRKRAAQAQLRAHNEIVPRAFWRLVPKSCDECKSSFARGCEAKRWSHWTCSSLGTIFLPMRINSVPDVKCFCNNKNVLRAHSMVWHFVRHPVWLPLPNEGLKWISGGKKRMTSVFLTIFPSVWNVNCTLNSSNT